MLLGTIPRSRPSGAERLSLRTRSAALTQRCDRCRRRYASAQIFGRFWRPRTAQALEAGRLERVAGLGGQVARAAGRRLEGRPVHKAALSTPGKGQPAHRSLQGRSATFCRSARGACGAFAALTQRAGKHCYVTHALARTYFGSNHARCARNSRNVSSTSAFAGAFCRSSRG
jgi:hypothetical protein